MKYELASKITALLLSNLFLLSCQTVVTNSVNNEPEKIVAAPPIPSGSALYKLEGCKIPLPEKKSKERADDGFMESDDGRRIKVTNTVYRADGDFVFTFGPFDLPSGKRIESESYKMIWIEEMKSKDKIFGYMIFAEPVEAPQTNDNSYHVHKQMFRCYDFDGDGDFEYLTGQLEKPITVPRWVTE